RDQRLCHRIVLPDDPSHENPQTQAAIITRSPAKSMVLLGALSRLEIRWLAEFLDQIAEFREDEEAKIAAQYWRDFLGKLDLEN
ncbi:MAG: hypothetical protein AB7N71_07435, partial [Phycisphaerae bacterium]